MKEGGLHEIGNLIHDSSIYAMCQHVRYLIINHQLDSRIADDPNQISAKVTLGLL